MSTNNYWPDRIREQNAETTKAQKRKLKSPQSDPQKSKGELTEGRPHPNPMRPSPDWHSDRG